MTALTVLRTPLTAADWASLGIDRMRVGGVALETGPPGWGFSAVAGTLPVDTWAAPSPDGNRPAHRSAATKIDHVVLVAPDLDEVEAAIRTALALEPRRRATPRPGGPTMAFYRAGEAVIEVVGRGTTWSLWGVALRVASMEAAVAAAGPALSAPRAAIQGGLMAEAARRWDGFSVAMYSKPDSPGGLAGKG